MKTIHKPVSRRAFLGFMGAAALSPAGVWAASFPVRNLWLVHQKTKEEFRAAYYHNGFINTDAYAKLCVLLRDTKANKATVMDQSLIDSLFLVQSWLSKNDYHQPIIVNSGYRTEETNRSTEGASQKSLHMKGW